jgi:hypothetical protein
VKEKWNFNAVSVAILLELQKLGDEVLDGAPFGLFTNKVETYTVVRR